MAAREEYTTLYKNFIVSYQKRYEKEKVELGGNANVMRNGQKLWNEIKKKGSKEIEKEINRLQINTL